jgi:hypothetical protein
VQEDDRLAVGRAGVEDVEGQAVAAEAVHDATLPRAPARPCTGSAVGATGGSV